MIQDLILFLILIGIFVSCFGVVTHASMYPSSRFDVSLFRSIFSKAYWLIGIISNFIKFCKIFLNFNRPIYGTIKILDEFDKIHLDQCETDQENDKECPQLSGVIFSYIFLTIYMIVANVLLLNLLIAMFRYYLKDKFQNIFNFNFFYCSSRYNKIQDNAGNFRIFYMKINFKINFYF